jgi:predicted  nucleic acid-binding Zn-ribbon protein
MNANHLCSIRTTDTDASTTHFGDQSLKETVEQQYRVIQELDEERTRLKGFVLRYERELEAMERKVVDISSDLERAERKSKDAR